MSDNQATHTVRRATRGRAALTAGLALLAAVFLLTATAQPAAADDPGATIFPHDYGTNTEQANCATPYRTGVLGQYGAWGYFVDGCTVRAWCPNWTVRCRATGYGTISTYAYLGHQVTMNSRVRGFAASGALLGWEDRSCAGVKYCQPTNIVRYLAPGQSASEQCNGVRQNAPNTAQVRCGLYLEYLYS